MLEQIVGCAPSRDVLERMPRGRELNQHELFRCAGRKRLFPPLDRRPRGVHERQMPYVRDRRRVAQLLATCERGDEPASELVEPLAGERAHFDNLAGRQTNGLQAPGPRQIDLVHDDNRRRGGRDQLGDVGRKRRRAIEHQNGHRGDMLRGPGSPHALCLDDVGGIAQSRGVDERHGHAAEIHTLAEHITRRARERR